MGAFKKRAVENEDEECESTTQRQVISTVQGKISINNEPVENVDSFVYLGSVIPNTTDVTRRTGLATQAFRRQRKPFGEVGMYKFH